MLTIGSDFAGYHVERLLGRGGMGDVYLARHPRLPRSDALKLMSENLSRSEVYRQRFISEADLASEVQHDSVVRVYDRGEDHGRLWIAMEYVDGRDLDDVLSEEGPLPVERAVVLLERVAAGLDAIHSCGLLHRDVKPANIMVARDMLGAERALITDFGIARSTAHSLGVTGVGDIVATLHYAAPEQFELRSDDLDRRVDVYALGCVLYEMLTGAVPLQGDSVAEFWRVMQSQLPVPASQLVVGVPASLDAVLAKALSKRREDRYDSAGELARAARGAISGAAMYPAAALPMPRAAQHPQPALVGQAYSGSGSDAPPTRLTKLAGAADEIASEAQRPTPAPLPEQPPAKRGKRRKLIAALISAALLGAAATAALLIVGGDEKPGLPAGLKVSAGRGTITVSWQPGAGKSDHYVVYRDGQVVGSSVSSTTFVDKVNDTATHHYKVQAVNETGAASNQTSESSVAAQVRDLTGPERALVGKLPTTLVDRSSCQPILAGIDSHLDVAVTCQPAPAQSPRPPAVAPQVVEAYGAASATALNAAVTDEINVHGAKSGSCSSTPQQGTWNFTQSPKVITGKIVCYAAPPRAYLLWSYTSARLYVRISTTNSYSSLLSYWQGAALHLS